jgi:hypothetical protein
MITAVDPSPNPILDLSFKYAYTDIPALAFAGLHLRQLVTLDFFYRRKRMNDSWLTLFSGLKELQVLRLAFDDNDMDDLISALTPNLREEEGSPVLLPRLKELVLWYADVKDQTFENLKDCLLRRRENQAELRRLDLAGCTDLLDCERDELNEIVSDFRVY